jgi:DNA-binding response OmpR family regulator
MTRILIGDDEPFILRSLDFVLRKEGFEVDTASDGEEGLGKLLERDYALAFLDIMMPRLGGFEVLQRLREERPGEPLRVVFLSAKGMEEDRARGLELGAIDYVSKPFSPAAVLQLVRHLCAGSAEPDQAEGD